MPAVTELSSDTEEDQLPVESLQELKQVYSINFVADTSSNLVLHWAIGKQHAGEWAIPTQLPANTIRVPGAVQTKFV